MNRQNRLALLLASASLLAACATTPAAEVAPPPELARPRPACPRRTGARSGADRAGRHPAPGIQARQRPDGARARGPQGAGRRGQPRGTMSGSKDEPKGKTGFAHLFEHLMFNGSENLPGDYLRISAADRRDRLQRHDRFDRTNYFQTVPKGALERALFMESDRMGYLLGAVTQEKLDNQRGVVQNEKRQGDNQPGGLVNRRSSRTSSPKAIRISIRRSARWPTSTRPALATCAMVHRQIRPEQCGARACRRHRRGDGPAAGREIFRRDRARSGQHAGRGRRADPRRAKVGGDEGSRSSDHASRGLGDAWLARSPARRAGPRRIRARRPRQLAPRQDRWFATRRPPVRQRRPLRRCSASASSRSKATVKPGVDPAVVEKRLDEIIGQYIAEGPTADELAERRRAKSAAGYADWSRSAVSAARPSRWPRAKSTPATASSTQDARQLRDGHACRSEGGDGRNGWPSRPLRSGSSRATGRRTKRPRVAQSRRRARAPTSRPEEARASAAGIGSTPPLDFPDVQHAALSNGIKVALRAAHDRPGDAGFAGSSTPASPPTRRPGAAFKT